MISRYTSLNLKLILIILLGTLTLSCASTGGPQSIAKEVEILVRQGDFLDATDKISVLLILYPNSDATDELIGSLRRGSRYEKEFHNAFKQRLLDFETILTASTYNEYLSDLKFIRNADLISANTYDQLRSEAEQIMLSEMSEFDPRSLRSILTAYNFNATVTEAAQELYVAHLEKQALKNPVWAANNKSEYERFGVSLTYKEAVEQALERNLQWAIANREKINELGLQKDYETALINMLRTDLDWARDQKEAYYDIVASKEPSDPFIEYLKPHVTQLNFSIEKHRLLSYYFPEDFPSAPPLLIFHSSPSSPNSAGGVDVSIDFRALTKKTIKYVVFTVVPYNRVGDSVRSTIDNEKRKKLRMTGPHKYETGNAYGNWETVWYNPTISCMTLEEVVVEFMNGSIEKYTGTEVDQTMYDNVQNNCEVDYST